MSESFFFDVQGGKTRPGQNTRKQPSTGHTSAEAIVLSDSEDDAPPPKRQKPPPRKEELPEFVSLSDSDEENAFGQRHEPRKKRLNFSHGLSSIGTQRNARHGTIAPVQQSPTSTTEVLGKI
ncbi:hypothetical protein TruAng_002313 [Truncatella angustata]|nr:hypothetical protein TruAng_002313 [Truncatella angustata]